MSDVWVGIVNRFVEKLFNVKGGPTVVDVNPSVFATLKLHSDNENRYLEGWNRFGFNVQVSAVSAQFSAVQIRNPAASGVILVVEAIGVNNGGGAATDSPTLTWGSTVTDLATVPALTFTRLDPRGNPQPVAIISSATGPTNGAVFQQVAYGANGQGNFIQTINQEYTVLPGQILKVFSNVANQFLSVSFLWRERVLETSELT